jgi:hypothetical protein
MKDLCNEQVRKEPKADENSNENEETPTGPQATGIKKNLSHAPKIRA